MTARNAPLAFAVAGSLFAGGILLACSDAVAVGDSRTTAPNEAAPFFVALSASVFPAQQSAYVSLPPDSIPTGIAATIRNVRTDSSVTAALVNGGFDPVAIPADVGDSIAITVQTPDAPMSFLFAVRRANAPVIVRTNLSPHERDVSLNYPAFVAVFSEPIDAGTAVGTTVRLLNGVAGVPAVVGPSDAYYTRVVLRPTSSLAPNTDYQFVIGPGILDLRGNPLVVGASIPFTTAAASTGDAPVATPRMQ